MGGVDIASLVGAAVVCVALVVVLGVNREGCVGEEKAEVVVPPVDKENFLGSIKPDCMVLFILVS